MKTLGIIIVSVLAIAALYGFNKSQKVNQHLSNPKTEENPDFNAEELIERIKNSQYYKNLQPLANFVKGQKVRDSLSGNSGFILLLANGTWASSYMEGNSVGSSFGQSEPPDEIKNYINNNQYGDASEPISQDTIYANQFCDIPQEVAKSHGKIIEGLSYGESSFNFAFEGGFELDVKLVEDKNKKPAFRVFWEQW